MLFNTKMKSSLAQSCTVRRLKTKQRYLPSTGEHRNYKFQNYSDKIRDKMDQKTNFRERKLENRFYFVEMQNRLPGQTRN